MGIVQSLSLIALRQVAAGASRAAGLIGAESVARFLGDHFTNHNRRLGDALQGASSRAWQALEIALAGESLWNRLDDADDRGFRLQLRAFLDSAAAAPGSLLTPLGDSDADFRATCLRELRAARKAGLLLGAVDAGELARQAADLAHLGNAAGLVEREWQALDQTADLLREARYTALARLVALRPGDGQMPLIAVAVRYFFRRSVESDAELHRGLSFAQWDALAAGQRRGFDQLGQALDAHGRRLDEVLDVLGEVRGAVLDLRQEIAGQREQIRALAHDVLQVLGQHQLERRELRGGDSLSIRTDDERHLVKELVARYRALPPEQRKDLPALLNAVGKMEVVAGNFDAARRDFQELVQILPSERERAEAHHNAYQAALEYRQWPEALHELRQAAALDSERFAPFPLNKFEPERILGAGGFGVAFLCRDVHMSRKVVVKALRADGLDRPVAEVFVEARVLEEVRDDDIIRVRHCDYAGTGHGHPYLVMDYFDGVTLEEHIKQHGSLPPAEAIPLLARVALRLHKAHEKGICHRDIKPANLLVRHMGEPGGSSPRSLDVKLIDFGLALRQQMVQNTLGAAASYTQTLIGSSIAGTLDYAAPEQLGKRPGDKVGPHSDIYGLGKTACFALFGTTMPLARHWRTLSPELADLLGQCLADDPKERPASCAEVAERLAGPLPAAPRIPVARIVEEGRPLPVLSEDRPAAPVPDTAVRIALGAVLGAAAGLLAGAWADMWVPDRAAPPLLFVVATLGLGSLWAALGRRQQADSTASSLRMTPALLALTVIIALLLPVLLHSDVQDFEVFRIYRPIFPASVAVLGAMAGLAYIWGRKLNSTAGAALALALIAFLGTALIGRWAPVLLGVVIGGGLAVAFSAAEPLRNLDRAVNAQCGALLEALARLLPTRHPKPTQSELNPAPIEAAPPPSGNPAGLAFHLGLLTLACGVFGLIVGLNSGATSMTFTYQDKGTMLSVNAVGGAAGVLIVLLVCAAPFLSTLQWLLGSGFVSIVGGLAVGGFWNVSPLVMLAALIVWGTLVGLLAGVRLQRPLPGAVAGGLLAGLIVGAGQFLGHPDTTALFGLALGLLTGTFLWSGLRVRSLRLARGIATAGLAAAIALIFVFWPALGHPARPFDAPLPGPEFNTGQGSYYSEPVFNQSGERLLTSDRRGVFLWNVATGKCLDPVTKLDARFPAMAFFGETPVSLIAQGSAAPAFYNVESGQKLMDAPRLTYASGFDRALVAVSTEREAFLMATLVANVWALELIHPLKQTPEQPLSYSLKLQQPLTAVALRSAPLYSGPDGFLKFEARPTGPSVLLGYGDGTVRLAGLPENDKTCVVKQETQKLGRAVTRLGFSPSGRWAYALDGNDHNQRALLIWEVDSWSKFFLLRFPAGSALATCAAFSPDDLHLLVGTNRGTIQKWDVQSRELLQTYKVHNSFFLDRRGSVRFVAFVPPLGIDAISQLDRDDRVMLWHVR